MAFTIKPTGHHVELVKSNSESQEEEEFTPKQQRKIIRHIDRRLIVMLSFMHTVSLIDRGNLGTAAVAGMNKELHLDGMQYVSLFPLAPLYLQEQ